MVQPDQGWTPHDDGGVQLRQGLGGDVHLDLLHIPRVKKEAPTRQSTLPMSGGSQRG